MNDASRSEREDVLYVVSLFPCWSETFIVRELNALQQAGIEVRVASLKPHSEEFVHPESQALCARTRYPARGLKLVASALGAFFRRPGVNTAWLFRLLRRMGNRPGELGKTLGTFVLALDFVNQLRDDPPSRVHAHWATYPSTAAMIMADNLGVPFSFTSHAHDIFVHDHLLYEKLDRADVAATISNYNIRFLTERLGELPARPSIVHCGVDPDEFRFDPGARKPGLIGSVGRLDEIKGFRHLIAACAELKLRDVPFRCRIIGEGPQRSELEALIARHELSDEVQLVGAKPQEEVRSMLRECSVFALPSVRDASGNMDGIPVALMEAMALGTPVISTRISGIPELIDHQRSGWLCDPGDEAALADGLARLLTDDELRRKLAAEARKTIERDFNCHREAGKLAQLFRGEPCPGVVS